MNNMNNFIEFFKKVFESRSGVSSKRVCGILGFLVILGMYIHASITSAQLPDMTETITWACVALLGVDSVTGIWKNFNNKE